MAQECLQPLATPLSAAEVAEVAEALWGEDNVHTANDIGGAQRRAEVDSSLDSFGTGSKPMCPS